EDVDLVQSDSDIEAEEGEEEISAAGALKGVKGRARFEDDDEELDEDEDEEEFARAPAAPAQWGVLPAIFLAPAFVIMILGSLIGYEMLHSMWGYHQPRAPGAPIVRGVAGMFDMEIKDQ